MLNFTKKIYLALIIKGLGINQFKQEHGYGRQN